MYRLAPKWNKNGFHYISMRRRPQKGSQADTHLHQADLMFPLDSLLLSQPMHSIYTASSMSTLVSCYYELQDPWQISFTRGKSHREQNNNWRTLDRLTFWFNKALASFCTSELSKVVPLMTLLRAARDWWTLCTKRMALNCSRMMNDNIGDPCRSLGGDTFWWIRFEF